VPRCARARPAVARSIPSGAPKDAPSNRPRSATRRRWTRALATSSSQSFGITKTPREPSRTAVTSRSASAARTAMAYARKPRIARCRKAATWRPMSVRRAPMTPSASALTPSTRAAPKRNVSKSIASGMLTASSECAIHAGTSAWSAAKTRTARAFTVLAISRRPRAWSARPTLIARARVGRAAIWSAIVAGAASATPIASTSRLRRAAIRT